MPKGDAKEGYLNTNAHLEAKVAMLMAQLAESQARELRLRDVFKWIEKNATAPEDTWYLAQATRAIAIPSDDSALREMIEAAKAEEREAIIKTLIGIGALPDGDYIAAIRARGDK